MIGQCWSCPWRDTDFYRLSNGILTAIKFQYEILGPIVRLYVGAVGPGLILGPYNTLPHVLRLCWQFLQLLFEQCIVIQ